MKRNMDTSLIASKYLTTEELSRLIKYDARTIRNRLVDSVLLEGVHYIRPFGRRKILFIRAAIERDIDAYLGLSPGADEPQSRSATPTPPTRRLVKPRATLGKARDVTLLTGVIPMAAGGACHV